ncbi:hypothetical protein LOK49_LG05G01151 [Camellia lanceoleosa]|uniref:Uncharacterized protein n=1 Tax=Camellia lanceoleosa TaxID=1840588 RepID=A0ACC0HU55_9ERIC|nr:hypothetical protein LOK49_LG05G01151 [Camellia lanceoleosa]
MKPWLMGFAESFWLLRWIYARSYHAFYVFKLLYAYKGIVFVQVSCFTCDPVDSNQTDCLLFYVLITANGMKWEVCREPTLIFLLVDTLQKFYQATARQEL